MKLNISDNSSHIEHHVTLESRMGMVEKIEHNLKDHIKRWAFIGGFMAGIVGAGVHLLEGCYNQAGQPTKLDVKNYVNDIEVCQQVVSLEDRMTCLMAIKQEFCKTWPLYISCDDGGTE